MKHLTKEIIKELREKLQLGSLKHISLENLKNAQKAMQIDYLNEPAVDDDGEETEKIHLLRNEHDTARFTRLRMILLSVCRTKVQEQVIDLLSEQYTVEEIADKLNITRQYVYKIIREIRSKCLKLKNILK